MGKSNTLELWKRPNSNTAAGLRNWNILIFYPEYQEGQVVEIIFPFDRNTKKEFLNSTSKKIARTSGYSVIAELELNDECLLLGEWFIIMKTRLVESIRLISRL